MTAGQYPPQNYQQNGQQQSAPPGGSWNIGGEGGNSFPFDNPGDYVTGYIIDLAEVQQTDPKDQSPQTWPNGDPKMQYRVTLETELRDPANPSDNGTRTVYLRGSKKPDEDGKSSLCAVLDAVKEATGGGTDLQYRGKVTLQYTHNGTQTNRAFNPPKKYAAWYEVPAMNLGQSGPPPGQQNVPQNRPPAQPPFNQGGQFPPQPAQGNPAISNQVAQEYAYTPQPGQPPQNLQKPTGPGQTSSWQGQGPGPDWAQNPAAGAPGGPPPAQVQQQAQPTGQQNDPWGPPPQTNPAWGNQPPPDQTPPQNTTLGQVLADPNDNRAYPQAAPQGQGPAGPANAADPKTRQITSGEIAGLQGIGLDPATVYGADWQSRVVS